MFLRVLFPLAITDANVIGNLNKNAYANRNNNNNCLLPVERA